MPADACDIAIITILDEELAALQKIFQFGEPRERNGIVFRSKSFRENSKNYSIICVQQTDYSNIPAATLATRILSEWNPRFILLVGIAGGVSQRENLQLGDVVISNNVYYVEVEKIIDEQKLGRPYSKEPPAKEFKNSHQISREKNWQGKITETRPGDGTPKVILGDIISGEKLEADHNNTSLQKRLTDYDKMIAVEMESGGVSKAIYEGSDRWPMAKFFAIRGISDFCDQEKNNEIRNVWRNYSAETAAAYTYELIKNLTVYGTQSNRYQDELPDYLPAQPETIFNITCSIGTGHFPLTSIIELANEKKRVILSGRAGIGKSNAINTISREILSGGKIPVVINLKNWNIEYLEKLRGREIHLREKMNTLLRMSHGKFNEKILEEIKDNSIFIVDGLNEINSGEYGNESVREVINTVDEYVRNYSNASPIIMTDRTNRKFADDYFSVVLDELSDGEVKKIINSKFGEGRFDSLSESAKKFLKIPYFLELALKIGNPDQTSETKSLELFFKELLGLDQEAINLISRSLFDLNSENGTLLFDAKDFEERIGSEAYQKLLDSTVIVPTPDGRVKFEHQLQHEFLISNHLIENEDRWDIGSLDVATLRANSFESLFMTIDQISDKSKCDKFLLHVYNWNWPAAIKCIARLEKNSSENYSESTLIAVASLVAQKMFDPVYGTSMEAKTRLVEIQNESCKKISEADSFSSLVDLVNEIQNNEEWFLNWREIFTWDASRDLSNDDLMKIKSEESLVGWTTSNALKRLDLNETRLEQLRVIYNTSLDGRQESDTVRWRIVHTLGSFPSQENASMLLSALEEDPYHWAKYGAARSIMEMAAKTDDPELRKMIIDNIKQKYKVMNAAVSEEIGKTSMYHGAFGGWETSIKPLLKEINQNLDEELTKREWKKIMKRFNDGRWK